MEREQVRRVAVENGIGPATGRLPGLRFGLGALTRSPSALAIPATAAFLTALAMAAFVRTAALRWSSFETNAFDLAFFDQIIYNTSEGRWFETSFVPYNFAGQHIEPILLVFVPAYWLGAGPLFLTVAQAVVAALAAVPLYLFARRLTQQPVIALAAVAAYLANPYLQRAIAFDFHPEVMVAFPAFSAAWAIVSGRRWLAIGATLSVLLFKEDTVFIALLLAGFMWSRGMKREARVTAIVAVTFAALAVLVVMPLIRGGESSDLVERYGYLLPGAGGSGVVESLLLLPIRAARVALHPEQIWTVALFLVTTCAIAITRPVHLAWLVPGLSLALLSEHLVQRRLELHYAAELVPAGIILALVAAAALRGRVPVRSIALLLAVPPIVGMLLLNPLGAGHGDPPSRQHRAAVLAALAYVPDDPEVSVSAQSGLLPRLSQRREAHEFPGNASAADLVVVDRYGFRSSQSLAAGFDGALEDIRATLELVYSNDGVEVFRRTP